MIKREYNYNKIILNLILILPFLDIYRAIVGNKIEIFGISMVEIFNLVFTFILLLLLWIKKIRGKEKFNSIKSIIYFAICIIYMIMHSYYIVTFNDMNYVNHSLNIFIEIYYIFRAYILPLIVLFVYMKSELKVHNIMRILSKLSFIISIIIVGSNLLGVSLVAYSSNYEGLVRIDGNIISWFNGINPNSVDLYTSRGLFYSTNQLSAILGGLLFVSIFYAVYQNKLIYYISFFIKILAAIMLSTKTAFFAIFFSVMSLVIYIILYSIFYRKKLYLKRGIIFILYIMVVIIIYNYSPIKYKLEGYIDNLSEDGIVEVDKGNNNEGEDDNRNKRLIELEEKYNLSLDDIRKKDKLNKIEKEYVSIYIDDCPSCFDIPKTYIDFYPVKENFDFWFNITKKSVSELTNYRQFKVKIYEDIVEKRNNNLDYLLGIGYSSNFPYLEKDFVGQKVWFGYIGMVLLLFPYIGIVIYSIINILRNLKRSINIYTYSLSLAAIFMISISLFAGHVFGIFFPSSILSLIVTGMYNSLKKIEINNKKISFLMLHLGYGGIESATINTANTLCNEYEVEIISFYKLKENQSAKLNKKVSIKYLHDGGPNKVEFLESLHNKKIFRILKEGVIACNILINKKALMMDSILQTNSKYVVSTRLEFSEILSECGRNDIIKIAQEHHHHNNDKKYINRLKKNYKNIDYLCALTICLKNDYEKIFINNKNTKVILLPNMLENIPNCQSNLSNKNIITISRLDIGKRNNEIIDILKHLNDKDVKLTIIGDGQEYNNLKEQIKKLNLEKQVTLTGYLSKEEIEKYLLDSSVFLMASISEGLPMVLLEAMSYGVPCIAYETDSGVNDIIDNNVNGYIIKNRDAKEYEKKLKILLSNKNKRKKMGDSAKEKSYKFSSEEIFKIWKNILK